MYNIGDRRGLSLLEAYEVMIPAFQEWLTPGNFPGNENPDYKNSRRVNGFCMALSILLAGRMQDGVFRFIEALRLEMWNYGVTGSWCDPSYPFLCHGQGMTVDRANFAGAAIVFMKARLKSLPRERFCRALQHLAERLAALSLPEDHYDLEEGDAPDEGKREWSVSYGTIRKARKDLETFKGNLP